MDNARRLTIAGRALFAAAALMAASAGRAAENYTVLMSGLEKGALDVDRQPGTIRTSFHFRDRGRGPDITTLTRVDARGMPTRIDISGTDYRRIATAEHFALDAGEARWTSDADQGSAAAGGYYYPYQANDADTAALARALLAAPDHRLKLLPAGEAAIAKVAERRVDGTRGPTAASLYFITGLDLQPAPIWLDADGALFAAGSGWLGVIRAGYEPAMPALLAAQEQTLAAAARAKAGALRRTPAGPLLIRDALLFDAEARRMRPHMSVLVKGERIAAVAPTGTLKPPPGAEIVDAHGRALLPGLSDMHVHLQGQEDGLLSMMAGITTVRDMGNDVDSLKALSDQFDAGTLVGPHVIKAGLIDGRGEYAGPTKFLVSTPDEMRAAIARFDSLGYPMIKLYSSVDPKLVPLAVEEAHRRGMHVGGHVPAGMTAQQAIDAGYDEISHANFWLLSFMGPKVVARTNTPTRFSDAYTHGFEIDPNGAQVRAFVADTRAHHAALDPTLVTFEPMFTGEKGKLGAWLQPWADRVPATVLRGGRGGGRGETPAQLATYRESFRRMEQILGAMSRAGVAIVPGTDGSALTYSRELELHVASGIAPAQVLYEATLGAARLMKRDAETGSIAPGKHADLVLVDGDPTRDISRIRRVDLVVKDGSIYKGDALAAAAGLAPRR